MPSAKSMLENAKEMSGRENLNTKISVSNYSVGEEQTSSMSKVIITWKTRSLAFVKKIQPCDRNRASPAVSVLLKSTVGSSTDKRTSGLQIHLNDENKFLRPCMIFL